MQQGKIKHFMCPCMPFGTILTFSRLGGGHFCAISCQVHVKTLQKIFIADMLITVQVNFVYKLSQDRLSYSILGKDILLIFLQTAILGYYISGELLSGFFYFFRKPHFR